MVLGGFGSFWVVPCFSNYEVVIAFSLLFSLEPKRASNVTHSFLFTVSESKDNGPKKYKSAVLLCGFPSVSCAIQPHFLVILFPNFTAMRSLVIGP